MQNAVRYWQITIIAKDDLTVPDSSLASSLIEHGIKKNLLPLFLEVHDVEAMEIGDKPRKIKPLPEDLHLGKSSGT